MRQAAINFYKEDTRFRLNKQVELIRWVLKTVRMEKQAADQINFIFCSDQYLLKMNREYLNHDYFTDIITFDHSTIRKKLTGDIFISIDRVSENAVLYNVSFPDELHRVMIHGILHLLGYSDKSAKQKRLMKTKEDFYLMKRGF